MSLIPFMPPPGIVSDDTTFTSKGQWADGSNVRFRLGKPEVIGGWTRFGSFTLSGTPTNMLVVASGEITVYGTTTNLYIYGAGTLYDITPSGFTSTTSWSLAEWGSQVLASPKGGKLYFWDGNVANDATHVTQAPSQITSMLVTPERQVLALGCNEESSGTFNSRCIRGCDLEDFTDWTTATDNNAFEHIIETTGPIVAGRMIGSYVGIWTQTGFQLGEFVGDPGQTYRFDRIGDHAELYSARSMVVVGPTAWWMSIDGYLRTYTLGGPITEMFCPIFREWADYSVSAGVFGHYNPQFNEVWFFYGDSRDAGSTNPNRFIAYSLTEKSWFRGKLARSAASSDYGIQMIAPDGKAYIHENGLTADGGALNWSIRSADHYFDESRRGIMIRRIVPDFEEQEGDVDLTLYVRDRAQSTRVTKGPYTIEPGDEKHDFRVTGNIVEVEFSGTTSGVRLGKPMFDIEVLGDHGQR